MMEAFALGLLAVPGMALAQTTIPVTPDPMVVTDMDPPRTSHQQAEHLPPDPANFCYFEGKAYSKGAIYAGQICSSGLGNGTAGSRRPAPSLTWMPARTR